MIMKMSELILIILFLIIIFIFLTTNIALKYKLIIGICLGIILFVGISLNIFAKGNTIRSFFNPEKIEVNEIDIDNLVIKMVDNRKVLFDEANNKKVNYINSENELYDKENFHLVLLKDLDDFYLAIYSVNINKDYSYGRYTHPDYEMSENYDCLILIDKISGICKIVKIYHLIGKTIDLNSFQNVGDGHIYFNIFYDYDVKVQRIELLIARWEENISSNYLYNFPIIHTFYPDNRYIEKSAAVKNFIIYVDSNKNVKLIGHSITYMPNSNGFTITTNPYDYSHLINNDSYVKAGYFTSHKGSLYIVGNDLKIYLVSNKKTYYADVVDLDNWTNQLP